MTTSGRGSARSAARCSASNGGRSWRAVGPVRTWLNYESGVAMPGTAVLGFFPLS